MNSNINLVSGKTSDIEKEQQRLKTVRIIAVVSLAFVTLISTTLFIITFTLPISSVKKDQEQTISSIALLHKKLVTYSLVNERAKNISEIISGRKNYGQISENILKKVPPELNVDTLDIEGSTLTIGISGSSLIPINKFIQEIIILAKDQKIIKNLIIQGLVLNPQLGKYQLSMQADLP